MEKLSEMLYGAYLIVFKKGIDTSQLLKKGPRHGGSKEMEVETCDSVTDMKMKSNSVALHLSSTIRNSSTLFLPSQ